MLIFVFTETMLFAGFISAFMIVKSGASIWPPPNQPRLPVEETALNTLALLASGAALYWAGRAFKSAPDKTKTPLLAALVLGTFFVGFQGAEWVALIGEGLTLTTSAHGGFFYVIVGTHALHAVGALLAMGYIYLKLMKSEMTVAHIATVQVLWYFVVGIWPILYWRVYL